MRKIPGTMYKIELVPSSKNKFDLKIYYRDQVLLDKANMNEKELVDNIQRTLTNQNLTIPLPTFNRQGWMVFFREALKASQKSFLNKGELLELQEEGNRLLEDIKGYDRYDFYMKVCELLREEAPSVIRTIGIQEDKYSSDMEQKSIR